MDFLPGLASLYSEPDSPQFLLCQVFLPAASRATNYRALERLAESLGQKLRQPVLPVSLCAPSVSDAIIDVARAQNCDAIVLGASREGLLHQAIHGNIPETILRGVEGTVILVRGADRFSSNSGELDSRTTP
jgi:CIC family chloride channel protein